MVSTILFDFGGVLAEDGFRVGLLTIANRQRVDPEWFQRMAVEAIYQSGYVDGLCEERVFWELFRKNTNHALEDHWLREFFIAGYVLWPEMIACVKKINTRDLRTVLISDHTNWLDELEEKYTIFPLFDRVYNSYHIHKSKREGTLFPYVLTDLGIKPEETLLIDDNKGNITRAETAGIAVYHFTDTSGFVKDVMPMLAG
jgi:putative hydrolase of the HAD superfamily